MGCDIHLHTEVKIGGQWYHYSAPSMGRNYHVFAKMCGVRNDPDWGITPITSGPRGLPEDASFLTRFASDEYGPNGHSRSYLTASEIAELEAYMETLYGPFIESKSWGYLFGNSWGGFTKYPGDSPDGLEDVRFVFWFDN